jgi:hypothetical protein
MIRSLLCAATLLLAVGCVADGSRTTTTVSPPAIQVVTYPSGLTGFFDAEAKTLYIYGSDLKTPFMTVKIEKLGEELTMIRLPTDPAPTTRATGKNTWLDGMLGNPR